MIPLLTVVIAASEVTVEMLVDVEVVTVSIRLAAISIYVDEK